MAATAVASISLDTHAQEARQSVELCAQVAGQGVPLPGVTIVLVPGEGAAVSLVTGSSGCATAASLAPGPWRLTFVAPGVAPVDLSISIPLADPRVVADLSPLEASGEQVVDVQASRERVEETRRTIQPLEARSLPGTGGDALKVIEDLPGAARSAFGSGALLIRGAAPEDSKVLVDGQQIPQLYHFGGLTSLLNTELLSAIDYLPGGFGVRYGGATGGVIELETRPGAADRTRGVADANVIDAQAVGEGGLGKDAKNGTVIAAARRSYLDAILPAVVPSDSLQFTTVPRYYDYQVRYDAPSSESGARGHVFVYGSDDAFGFVVPSKGTGTSARGRFFFETKLHRVQGSWTVPLASGWLLTAMPTAGYQDVGIDTGSALSLSAVAEDASARVEATGRLGARTLMLIGAEAHAELDRYAFFLRDGDLGGGVLHANNTYARGFGAVYLQPTIDMGRGFTFIPGLRADVFTNHQANSIDPRATLRFEPTDQWTFKTYAGLYHRPPSIQEGAPKAGNPSLRSPWALQAGVGGRRALGGSAKIEGELFYKWLGDQIVTEPADPSAGRLLPASNNAGIGRAYGAELLFKRDFGGRFFGWLAYTLSKAERADPYTPGGWRRFEYDQTHILTLLGGWRIGHGWEVGARARYVTGNPVTGVAGSVFNADTGAYVPVNGPANGSRLPAYQQLDIRVDRRFQIGRAVCNAYLDLQNATNAKNAEAVRYDYRYSEKAYVSGTMTIPSIGIRAEF